MQCQNVQDQTLAQCNLWHDKMRKRFYYILKAVHDFELFFRHLKCDNFAHRKIFSGALLMNREMSEEFHKNLSRMTLSSIDNHHERFKNIFTQITLK